ILIENFNRSTPAFALTVVNLSKIEHLALNDLTTPTTAILDDVPIAMLFAVFDPRVVPQKHYGPLILFTLLCIDGKSLGLHYRHCGAFVPLSKRLSGKFIVKNRGFSR